MNKVTLNKILTLIFILSFVLIAPSTQAANLDDLLNKKDRLNQDLEKAQSAAQNKQKEAQTLQSQIGVLESDISNTQKKIEETGGQISQKQSSIQALSGSIDKKKLELADLKKKLNAAIIEIYRSSSRSDLELLFSDRSLAAAENQSNYIESVQLQVKVVFNKVQNVKQELEKQKSDEEQKKAELDQLKNQQEAYKKSTEYQVGQKDKLLGMTKEQGEEYLRKAKEADKQLSVVEEQIRQTLSSRKKKSDGTFGDGPGVGSKVRRGDYIGTQGSTGFSTGDHVHFEVDLDGPAKNWTNPHSYIDSGVLSWPLSSFRLTQDYGEPSNWYKIGYHMGIDIAGPSGSPVLAPADGTVVLNEYFGGYGHAWAMKVDNGPYVLLGHLR